MVGQSFNTSNAYLFTAAYDSTNHAVYLASAVASDVVRVDLTFGTVDRITLDPITFPTLATLTLDITNQNLWVTGVRGVGTTYITAIPTNNFTQAAAYAASNNYVNFIKQQLSFAVANTNDGRYIYYASSVAPRPGSRPRIFRFNTLAGKFDRNVSINWDMPVGSFNGTANLQGGFYDSNFGLLYLWALGQNSPARLTKVNVTSFEQLGVVVFDADLGAFASSAAFDQTGQQVFFGHDNAPAVVTHINLAKFQLVSTTLMNDGVDNFLSGVVVPAGDIAYFATATDTAAEAAVLALPERCPKSCSGHGTCLFGVCQCSGNWTAEACDILKCPFNCSGNGVCNNGTCACSRDYTGDGCERRQCPNNCNGPNGECMTQNNYVCQCNDLWYGDDCSLYPGILPCDRYTEVVDCLSNNPVCGWCADDDAAQHCISGNTQGPYSKGCQQWSFGAAPYEGNLALGWITNAVVLFVLAVNLLATLISDLSAPSDSKDRVFLYRYRWRTQQSGKIWQMVDQVQWIAITGYLGVELPPVYTYFVNTFRWSILAFGMPWDSTKDGYARTEVQGTPRWLLTMEQNASSIMVWPDQVFLANLIWFAVVFGAFFVIFGILVVVSLVLPSENFKSFARNRMVFTLLRVTMFGHLGLMCTAAYTIIVYANDSIFMRSDISTTAIAVAIVILALLGLGLPVFTFVLLNGKKKELFDRSFSMKFGCLFHNYHFKRSLFHIVVFIKKLAIGLIIGLLSRDSSGARTAQILLLVAVQVGYFGFITVTKPYLDHIHHFVDSALSIINTVSMLMMFGFLKSDGDYESKFGTATVAVLLHIISVAIALVGWINSVFKMYNIRSFGQFIDALRGKHSTDPVEMSAPKR